MLLAEITFNRKLIKTPHPMYERFWLVSYIPLAPKDIKNVWIFKNQQEQEEARKNYQITDLIMDKYTGDYLVWFKSDNGVYGAAILDFDYVSRHGNGLHILGASFTEKSAWAAAQKAIENKGHRWDANLYSLLSVEPRDNSIFKLDRDEDISVIAESFGKDALRFADYLASFDATLLAKQHMKELALMLLRRGFKLFTEGGVRLNDDPPGAPGFGFSFLFPNDSSGHQRMGILTVLYTDFKEDSNGVMAFHKWTSHYSASEILGMGLDKFMDHARSMAKPIR